MFKVSSQDYQYWRLGSPKPEVKTESFATEQEARVRYNELKASSTNILVTIQPIHLRARGKQTGLKDRQGNKFNAEWKLHR
jgi:hypothetical protein